MSSPLSLVRWRRGNRWGWASAASRTSLSLDVCCPSRSLVADVLDCRVLSFVDEDWRKGECEHQRRFRALMGVFPLELSLLHLSLYLPDADLPLSQEMNEWRARARVPQLATPVHSDAHEAVLRAETGDFDLVFEKEGLDLKEEDEMPEEDIKNTRDGNDTSIVTVPDFACWSGAAFYGSASPPVYPEQLTAPLPFEVSPSSPASSASGGWEGPATPPSSATPMHAMTHAHTLAPLRKN
ncbi:hypothetical protein C8R47DRAFT_1221916 [Mycena vitilis]|nr:hypothetical protein C8R47DRAFT_1221916 [Mycena vitilis]